MAGAEGLWADCVRRLRLEYPDGIWNAWLSTARPAALTDDCLTLRVPSRMFKDRIESRYLERVRDVLSEVAGSPHQVVLEVAASDVGAPPPDGTGVASAATHPGTEPVADPPGGGGTTSSALLTPGADPGGLATGTSGDATEPAPPGAAPPTGPGHLLPGPGATPRSSVPVDGMGDSQLNPQLTFENFVTGESNRFAHAAALAVAEQPASSWNPLFIYGDTGLGKTHLLQAIGHYVLEHYPAYKVRYVSTETFLNEFVDAIRTNAMPTFKRRYRECQVLLVDDIQFIENKERFQEEFFHTFDSLHSAGRQVVISSDRPPKAIATLEDRLRSRFGGGLITDVQPPELETRLAILRKKAEREPVPVPPDVLEYIATHVTDNIRELEGALVRILAYRSLNHTPITREVAETVLSDVVGQETRQLTPRVILQATAEMFDFPVEDLIGKSRSRPLVQARQIGMYVFRELTDYSYPAIGRVFGNRDHTTVMHAVEKISGLMKERRTIYEQVTALIQRLRTGG